jgi:protein kinase-like protein
MLCQSCRGDLAAGARFCPACGTPAHVSDATTQVSSRVRGPAPAPRPPSTDPIDNARFIPGTILAGRYRIVTLLGRGGMGEVYRADDLKLGQPVALKFLPEDFAQNSERLARFHQEVRLARQVSHPNVCRVYDIGEVDIDATHLHFLSMEYVDGEDLASLLRRIGRLPPDKALQVARQLCAGLAAAHDRGVLHRDLKPANALLDSHGRVRIADFGLASLAEERRDPHLLAGTPAYMAPEQLAGRGASTRTDVYALGLILYEIFTGKAAHAPAEAIGNPRESSRPTHPSAFAADVDPVVGRAILRCLEPDPAQRLASALAVAAALPGGDPLGAALAAGETPSPEMVAAAGDRGSIAPGIGLALVAAVLLGLGAVMWMSPQTTLLGLVAIEKSPEALVDRARDFARSLGYTNPVDEAYGYAVDGGYLSYVADHDRSPTRWQVLRREHQSAIRFWYRQSPTALTPLTFSTAPGRVTPLDPTPIDPGMVSVTMDTGGRLIQFRAVSTGRDAATTNAAQPDWAMLFSSAGLSINRLHFHDATGHRADIWKRASRVGRLRQKPTGDSSAGRGGSNVGQTSVLRNRARLDADLTTGDHDAAAGGARGKRTVPDRVGDR